MPGFLREKIPSQAFPSNEHGAEAIWKWRQTVTHANLAQLLPIAVLRLFKALVAHGRDSGPPRFRGGASAPGPRSTDSINMRDNMVIVYFAKSE